MENPKNTLFSSSAKKSPGFSFGPNYLATGFVLAALSFAVTGVSFAQASSPEETISKVIAESIKDFPKIDKVVKTPFQGIYEVQYGGEVIYANKDGSVLIQGTMIQTKDRKNLTAETVSRLTAIDFKTLPEKDAFKVVRGNGERKIAVFADPNCGFCKRFEGELKKLDNATIYTYLLPVLGADSQSKARDIWCAADRDKAWENWMLNAVTPPAAAPGCDSSAIDRNVAFAREKKITGTPTSYFTDGRKVSGAIALDQIIRNFEIANGK